MAKKGIKCLFPVRDRKSELSESKFSCPFPKKNGKECTVLQKYRNLKDHCRHMHGCEISLRCMVEQCSWKCHVSVRCLTSHRANLETHGVLTVGGCKDLDATCKVVPYVGGDHGSLEEHTAACAVATLELNKYKGKVLKRADRAKAKAVAAWKEKALARTKVNWEVDFPEVARESVEEIYARALKRKYGSTESEPLRKKRFPSRDVEKTVVSEPVVAGAAPILSPRKVSFSNFKSHLGQLAPNGQNHIEWADFHALLKSHNMQISRPAAQLGSGGDQVKVAEE
jgi:hypothetical protein